MMAIRKNKNLIRLNTLGLQVVAKYFTTVHSKKEIHDLCQGSVFQNNRRYILGGGSNVLFTKDFDGLIIKSALMGISVVEETDTNILLQIGSGEVWHKVVLHCVKNNWGGLENLSLIPGCVGAAPIQNIGAYGVEIKNVIQHVNFIDLNTSEEYCLDNLQCQFGYRQSIFKRLNQKNILITSITLILSKRNHTLYTSYGEINDYLISRKIKTPTIQDVCDTVIHIRKQKLPDPSMLGNAGSFFKNPIISHKVLSILKREFEKIPYYSTDNQEFKISAGWLIEHCGWLGKRIGNVGVYKNQALVIVNFGKATGQEILDITLKISQDVYTKFDLTLELEVNVI